MTEVVVGRCSVSLSAPSRTVCGPKVQRLCVPGWSSARGDLSPSSPTSSPTPGWLPENLGGAQDQPSAERTQVLASQARRFLAKVSGAPALPGETKVPWRKQRPCLLG